MPDSSNKMSNICDDTTFLNSNIEIITYFTSKIIKISIVSALGQTYLLKDNLQIKVENISRYLNTV